MAFRTAAGYNNLPNGNFSAVIYSKKVQVAYRKKTLVEDILNSDYFGEIADHGDTVRIIKEPEINVQEYSRGQTVSPQDLDDEDFTLVIDKSNYFSFKMDDIEKSFAHVDFEQMASSRAGYRMADQVDQEVLGYISGYKQSAFHANADTVNDQVNGTKAVVTAGSDELLSSMKLKKGDFGTITTASAADHSIPVGPRLRGETARPTAYVSPLDVFNRMARLLDQQLVPQEGRWLVIDPVMLEVLKDENSALVEYTVGDHNVLQSGKVPMNLGGFRVYMSNNLPDVGTGPATTGTANQNTNFGVLVAGHSDSAAMASRINKVESFRSETTFADVVRGMNLYGRKILRPESIVTAKYNLAG